MPVLLRWLAIIGTVAMLWVGGHILLVGADTLGWHGPTPWSTTRRRRCPALIPRKKAHGQDHH
jgi:predicted DNA repair protein MutK